MPREYKKIKQHELEFLEMKQQGLTHQEMGERLGYYKKQIKEFFCSYNERQRKLSIGITLKRKGRPLKEYIVSEQDKVGELKYILARKEAKIKSLEMKNE